MLLLQSVSITGDAYIMEIITPIFRKELGEKPINVVGILTVDARTSRS